MFTRAYPNASAHEDSRGVFNSLRRRFATRKNQPKSYIHGVPYWPLEMPLLRLSKQGDIYTLGDACMGNICMGPTGSGKSSSVGKKIPIALMTANAGLTAICTKPETRDHIIDCAHESGRHLDIVILDERKCFNFILAEALSNGGFAGVIIDNLMDVLNAALEPVRRQFGGKEQEFFEMAKDILGKHSLFIDIMGNGGIDLGRVLKINQSLPTSLASLEEPDKSFCLATLERAKRNTPRARRGELELAIGYFEQEIPLMSDRTRTSIQATWTNCLDMFQREPLKSLTSGKSSVTPQMVLDGKIVILDLPLKTHFVPAKIMGSLWKRAVQRAIERRLDGWTGDKSLIRPTVIVSDDGHFFTNKSDNEFQSTSRSARGISLLLTQGIPSLMNEVGKESKSQVDELLMNLQCKFFCQTDDLPTREYASKLCGERKVRRRSGGVNAGTSAKGGSSSGTNSGWSEAWEPYFRESEFGQLRMGGVANNCMVDVIVKLPARKFKANGGWPAMKVAFDQNYEPDRWRMFLEKEPTARIWSRYVRFRDVLDGKVDWYEWAWFWAETWS